MRVKITLDLICPSCGSRPVVIEAEVEDQRSGNGDVKATCVSCPREVKYGTVPVEVA